MTAACRRDGEDLLDERSRRSDFGACNDKGEQFAGQVGRITDQTVKIDRMPRASSSRRSMTGQERGDRPSDQRRQPERHGGGDPHAGTNAGRRPRRDRGGQIDHCTHARGAAAGDKTGAIEESKQTAAATVAEMMETHTMLRSNSTALFERLREANILLQEVLSGAHENMSSIEHTMATRVSEFVAAMTDLSSKTGATTSKVEQHLGNFNTVTGKVLGDLGDLANQFSSHGRTLGRCRCGAGERQPPHRGIDRAASNDRRNAGFHSRYPRRRFRPAAGALLRAFRISRCRPRPPGPVKSPV